MAKSLKFKSKKGFVMISIDPLDQDSMPVMAHNDDGVISVLDSLGIGTYENCVKQMAEFYQNCGYDRFKEPTSQNTDK